MQRHSNTEDYKIQRVLVIGLDGATFDLIKPWTEAGLLPTFKRLFEHGAHGVMKSTIPVHSTPSWTSVVTGKSPCKHGIWYPIKLTKGKIRITSSSDLRCETIWEILNGYGKKVIVFNVPLTYPPQKIDGVLVTGMETPSLNAHLTYPSEIKDTLLRINYEIDLDDSEQHILFYSDKEKLFHRLCEIEKKRVEAATHLLRNHDWDFAIVVLNLLDRCQHAFWQFLTQKQRKRNESRDKQNFVLMAYQEICRLIDKITSEFLDDRTVIVLVSDHGFGPMNKCFHINNWLKKQGFLQTKKNLSRRLSLKVKVFLDDVLRNPLGARFVRLLYWMLSKTAFSSGDKASIQKLPKKGSLEDIDFSRTRVYSPFVGFGGYGFLKTNVGGQKNMEGMLDPVDREKLAKVLERKLKKVVDPENGQKIVKKVHRAEVFFGEQLADPRAPDFIIETERGYICHYPILSSDKHLVDMRGTPWNGSHEQDGIFLTFGLNIKKSSKIKKSTVMDVMPTILYMFGLPIPKNVDGKVMMECFEDEYLKSNKLCYGKESTEATRLTKAYTKKEVEKLKDRLRSLGYL